MIWDAIAPIMTSLMISIKSVSYFTLHVSNTNFQIIKTFSPKPHKLHRCHQILGFMLFYKKHIKHNHNNFPGFIDAKYTYTQRRTPYRYLYQGRIDNAPQQTFWRDEWNWSLLHFNDRYIPHIKLTAANTPHDICLPYLMTAKGSTLQDVFIIQTMLGTQPA